MIFASRSAPLLLLVGAITLWVILRSLFLVMSGPWVPPPPPLILSDARSVEPLWPFVVPDSAAARSARVAPALHRAAPAVPRRPSSALATARPVQSAGQVALATPPSRDSHIAAAQSLLLARMLGHRPYSPRPLGFGGMAGEQRSGLAAMPPARRPAADRWSLAGGLYWRQGAAPPTLGSSPTLGGSQAWARLGWQPSANAPILFVRANSAGRLGRGAEAALGVALRPDAGIPVQIIAERRQRVAGDGRSAFALYAAGGTSAAISGWQLEGYGAAGVVGARRRDGFAEGSATLARPIARLGVVELSAGSGAWGAAQPGVSRLDIGPVLSARSDDLRGARLALDWRQRVAGNAAPDSGPAVTLSMDF